MELTKKAQAAIIEHAAQCYPRESCGVIVKRNYIPCKNTASGNEHFIIDPRDLVRAEAAGTITAIVHSHPDGAAVPSTVDKQQMQKHGLPWAIVAYPGDEIAVYDPPPTPLVNREYIHGSLDCFGIVRDYFARELNIKIDDFDREDLWWEKDGDSLYADNFKNQGFIEVDTLQRHDVILCRVQPTQHINHSLIYLGDNGTLASEDTEPLLNDHLVLHHPYLRRSRREIYGNVWRERTAVIVRHKSLF